MSKMGVPNGFVQLTADKLKLYSQADPDTEHWLVQVPRGFDLATLDNTQVSIMTATGSQTIKVRGKGDQAQKKYYSLHSYRDSADCKKMSMVVADGSGQISLGPNLQHMLVVSESFRPSRHVAGSLTPSPKAPVPLPSGLKARFTTFGTGTPCPSHSKLAKKRKRDKTHPEDVPLASDWIKDQKHSLNRKGSSHTSHVKPQNKAETEESTCYSQLWTSSLPEIVPRNRMKRKWNESQEQSDHIINSSSPSPAKKNKKHRTSKSSFSILENGDVHQLHKEKSHHKHKSKKKNKSEESAYSGVHNSLPLSMH